MQSETEVAKVSKWLLKWGTRLHKYPKVWRMCGKFESTLLKHQLSSIQVEKPIYICGLARSGSTILLEILNTHVLTSSFCYEDFPFVHMPWFWSIKKKIEKNPQNKIERAHKDRILVSGNSPEALEELLWMNFNQDIASIGIGELSENILENSFSDYYLFTIKKLLYANSGQRYLSKANYNVGRIKAILKMLPDAKFIIPIRSPINHVASLIKQHELFTKWNLADPNVAAHLSQMGHFEFGPQRLASTFIEQSQQQKVQYLFQTEQNILAYAKQWLATYGYVKKLLADKVVKNALHIIRYETLCEQSESMLGQLFDFCQLDDAAPIIDSYKNNLSMPVYYQVNFSDKEKKIISYVTEEVAHYFGYHRR